VLSNILEGPENTILVRCGEDSTQMSCVSDETGPNKPTISWTYDGNTVISPVCINNTQVFLPTGSINESECGLVAMLGEAANDANIRTVSGPYGCTDQTSVGRTHTSMVLVLGTYSDVSFVMLAVLRFGLGLESGFESILLDLDSGMT